ncbi:hypothetical protein EYZ11_006075 [Aspergillus tanneri]|uniref:Lactate/malate dehydrogenase N-terminal domain-containing protein n=1 Tax=Aspergillus tanneri TaxID=1220188 RepID=A0A4S3JIU3_9EURO|nr:uncharacterized protein ATNIH1004_006099 [Aspergillus tanneri]KAA8647406.1 hypothetical protein ATNIH1004_006099 [Aspergillus tanneri]THC94438.1 hypothetical protein EYZ11_006075 [Aspergillus tanneri]
MNPIRIIGAAGETCRVVIQRLIPAISNPLVLADINLPAVEYLIANFPSGRAVPLHLTLHDCSALLDTMHSPGLLVCAVGLRNGHPAMVTKRKPAVGAGAGAGNGGFLMKSMTSITGT